jgi:hypothetical protein
MNATGLILSSMAGTIIGVIITEKYDDKRRKICTIVKCAIVGSIIYVIFNQSPVKAIKFKTPKNYGPAGYHGW